MAPRNPARQIVACSLVDGVVSVEDHLPRAVALLAVCNFSGSSVPNYNLWLPRDGALDGLRTIVSDGALVTQ